MQLDSDRDGLSDVQEAEILSDAYNADTDGDGLVSVQEAALMAEELQRAYMHDVVLVVPEFLEMYHSIGVFPDEDPTFPDVILDDALGEPLYLDLDNYR